MTKTEWMQFQEKFFNEIVELSKKKNADYTGTGDDPFANFKHVATFFPNQENVSLLGLFTRMTDKFSRLASFVEGNQLQVNAESVTDTLQDLACYASLAAGIIESTKETK